MFVSTGNKGFQITFSNDYTINCQFGAMNYCEHYGRHLESGYKYGEESHKPTHSSADCEVTIWKKGVKEPVTAEAAAAAKNEAQATQIRQLIAKKQTKALEEMPIEALQTMLADLEK